MHLTVRTWLLGTFGYGREIKMFSFIIRGLYFTLRFVILPNDFNFRFGCLFHDDLEATIAFFTNIVQMVRLTSVIVCSPAFTTTGPLPKRSRFGFLNSTIVL